MKSISKTWLAGAVALLAAQSASATLTAAGPNAGANGFPRFYQDSTSLMLGQCLDNADPNCLPIDLPNPAAAVAFPNNFPNNFFYWTGEAELPLTGGGDCQVLLSVQGSFASATPTAGQRVVLNRTRILCNLTQAGTYRVTWPFGTANYVISAVVAGFEINDFVDTGAGSPQNFTAALGGSNGPFLTWDPAFTPAAPTGYVGNPNVLHRITGSPLVDAAGQPQNYVRVERLGGATPVQIGFQQAFYISGKIAVALPVDTTAPTVVAPRHDISGTTVTATTSGVTISWSGSDANGITQYTLERSVNGGAFAALTLASPTATTFTAAHTFGSTYLYRVRAADEAGNTSANATGLRFNPTLRQGVVASITYSVGWTTFSFAGSLGGTIRATDQATRTATTTFNGTSAAWIHTKASNRGIGEALVDTVSQGNTDLYSAASIPLNIAFITANLAPGTHSLQVRSTGLKNAASSAIRVDLDAFLILATVP